MPIWLASLLGGLFQVATSFVGRIMLSLGMSYVTYKGYSVLLKWIVDEALARINTLPQLAIQMLGVMQIGTSFNILASAITIKFVMMGITGDAFTKLRQGAFKK